jgi:hypothetical protein
VLEAWDDATAKLSTITLDAARQALDAEAASCLQSSFIHLATTMLIAVEAGSGKVINVV